AHGHDEALVARGGEARQEGQVTEDAGEAEEEDARREHARDRRAGDSHQLISRPADQRSDRGRVAAGAHQPLLARPRTAAALSARPTARMPRTEASPLSSS